MKLQQAASLQRTKIAGYDTFGCHQGCERVYEKESVRRCVGLVLAGSLAPPSPPITNSPTVPVGTGSAILSNTETSVFEEAGGDRRRAAPISPSRMQ